MQDKRRSKLASSGKGCTAGRTASSPYLPLGASYFASVRGVPDELMYSDIRRIIHSKTDGLW